MGKGAKEKDWGLIRVTVPAFVYMGRRNSQIPSARIFGLLADVLTWDLPNTKEESTHLAETSYRSAGYRETSSIHTIRRLKVLKEKQVRYDL